MLEERGKSVFRHNLTLRGRGSAKRILTNINPTAYALLTLGQAVYEVENAISDEGRNVRRLEIALPRGISPGVKARQISDVVQRILSFIVMTSARVRIAQVVPKDKTTSKNSTTVESSGSLHLFSGGVDSLVGVSRAQENGGLDNAVYCSHAHQSHLTSDVRHLNDTILATRGVEFWEVPVPRVTVGGYSQTRGFLYMLSGIAIASMVGAGRVFVNECGPTMYQTKFAIADQITMTTHPFVVDCANEIAGLLCERDVSILLPFENATKAEMMASCGDASLFPSTFSCVTQRLGKHDGTCFGCVVRRLAALAAGVPDVEYMRDPLTDDKAKSGNLLSVVEFCADLLVNPRALEDYSTHLITTYNKWDLYKRWALDNFAAVQRILDNGTNVIRPVMDEYLRVKRKIGAERLRERIRALDGMHKKRS